MRSVVLTALLALAAVAASPAFAAGGDFELLHADNDVGNTQSLQRGARNFMSYCFGCHSTQYVRYNRVARDLEIPEELLSKYLMFASESPHETMTIAMPAGDATRWFGIKPPDLSLTSRSKGSDWIYTFLKSFYLDEKATTGVNNMVLKGASMPHVLWDLQGTQKAVFETEVDKGGHEHEVFKGFEQVTPGTLTAEEYDDFVRDIVNFLDYVGEPIQLERRSLGVKVIAYLIVFFILALFLKKEYWKDVR